MAECPALDVFAGKPDRRAVGEDRGERQLLGGGPVDGPFGGRVEGVPAPLARPLELPVGGESLRDGEQMLVQLTQPIERDGGRARGRPCPGAATTGVGSM